MDHQNLPEVAVSNFPLPSYENLIQFIKFPPDSKEATNEIVCSQVRIQSSSNIDKQCTSMVKFRNDVNYDWEDKYYCGYILAIHKHGKLAAFALSSGSDAVVRVKNVETQERTLLKGMKGAVMDLSFAYIDEVLIGIVDQYGNLLIFLIEEPSFTGKLILHIHRNILPAPNTSHRIIWVPYLPDVENGKTSDSADNNDVGKFLGLVLGNTVELWHIKAVCDKYGVGVHQVEKIEEGRLVIEHHTEPITDATFAPDGTALATVSLDGTFRFFQVYMLEETPRCLYNWTPHNSKPLSCVYFLDNFKNQHPELFWTFVITGAENNTEFKLWKCTNWSEIQTISIASEFPDDIPMKCNTGIDPTGRFFMVSDRVGMVVYLFRIFINEKESEGFFSLVSLYKVPFSILSFRVTDTLSTTNATNHGKCYINGDADDEDDDDDDEEAEEKRPKTLITVWLVHPKSFQNGQFYCESPGAPRMLELSTFITKEEPLESHVEPIEPPLPVNLMTPEAFTSPSRKEDQVQTPIQPKTEVVDIVLASGGSSPSREVREILSSSTNDDQENISFYSEGDGKENGVTEEPNNSWPHIPQIPDSLKPTQEMNKRCSLSKSTTKVTDRKPDENEQNPDIHKIYDLLIAQGNQIRELKMLMENRVKDEQQLQMEERIAAIIENFTSHREIQQRDDREMAMVQISQTVENSVTTKLRDILPQEIRKTVLPEILKVVETFHAQLRIDMTKQLSVTDHLLTENISKLVQSKAVTDIISNSFSTLLRGKVADSCKEVLTNFVLPQLEKVLERIFKQIHETFTSGVKESLQLTQKEMDKMLVEARRCSDGLKEHGDLNKKMANVLHTELHKGFLSLSENVKKQVTEVVQKEMQESKIRLENGVLSAVRAVTPAPVQTQVLDVQSKITQLLATNRINAAFQEALSASDLNQVVFICQKVPVDSVFHQTECPLEQPVLLSLIQQLGADMTNYTALKCAYLSEAILFLDLDNAIIKDHIPARLSELHKQLTHYISLHPGSKYSNDMMRILKVSKLMASGSK